MKTKIKELRVHIDGFHQLINGLNYGIAVDISLKRKDESMKTFIVRARKENLGFSLGESSYQTKKAADSLLMAKYWLGDALKAIDAEVTPDVSHQDLGSSLSDGHGGKPWREKSHPEKVDWLRQEIQGLFGKFPIPIAPYRRDEKDGRYKEQVYIYSEYCWKGLSEARFWLEEELKRIEHEQV